MAKQKFQIEQMLTSTSDLLIWNAIATPSGLQQWFADHVEVNQRKYTFYWGKEESRTARLSATRSGSFIRFKWEDEEDPQAYFEFRISYDELTGDYMLLITDFAEPQDLDDTKELWHTEINDLLQNTSI